MLLEDSKINAGEYDMELGNGQWRAVATASKSEHAHFTTASTKAQSSSDPSSYTLTSESE